MDGRLEDLGYRPGPSKKRKDMTNSEKRLDTATNVAVDALEHTVRVINVAMAIGGLFAVLALIVFGVALALGK